MRLVMVAVFERSVRPIGRPLQSLQDGIHAHDLSELLRIDSELVEKHATQLTLAVTDATRKSLGALVGRAGTCEGTSSPDVSSPDIRAADHAEQYFAEPF